MSTYKTVSTPKTKITQKDIDKSVYFLSRTFEEVIGPLSKNRYAVKGEELYDFQVDFMWRIHDIKMGPKYQAPVAINECEKFIKDLKTEIETKSQSNEGDAK